MNGYQILEVELHDYRQYEGTVPIDLACSDDEHINVIQGQNGAGKSNLFNAITLCLYGEEFHLKRRDVTGAEQTGMVSLPVLNRLDVNESASGYVRLTIGQAEPRYRLTREFQTFKTGPNDYVNETSELRIKQKIGHDWKQEDTPNTIVNNILPPQISEYFLFDGERLSNFLTEDTAEDVRQGILDVSQIQLLNNAVDHLERVEEDLRGRATDPGPEIEELRSQRRQVEQQIEELREERDRIERNIEEAQSQVDRINEELANVDVEEVRRIQKQRTKLEAQVENNRDELERVREETRSLIADAGMLLYAQDAIESASGHVGKLFEEGRLTPEVRDHLIDQLLDDGECLCGVDVSEGERREHLKSTRSETPVMLQEHMDARAEFPRLIESGEQLAADIDANRNRIAELNAEIDEQNERLEEISEKFKQSDVTPDDVSVAEREEQRSRLEEDIAEFREELGAVTADIEELESEREAVQDRLDAAMAQRDEYQSLVAKQQFAREAQGRLEQIRSEILEGIQTDIETKANEYYNQLVWKDDTFEVTLHENYEISVENQAGDRITSNLAAGERQILALSFLSALAHVSGFNAPIVIDTPLSRIASENKRRIGENLPAYLDDTQITLLVTDEEYTDDLRVRIKDSVANEHRIEYENETSQVVPL